ncbi:MAG: bifunctional 3,4-dihydroxy-2-butanone-4-phosphate synthase/GTP cyclohydrolase II [Gammaproteobacteria bacterium]|nr:bifunctional 3,4-dihydroxy-2-butanone-4-phosphate synthase/GTP cyclohydrolase II [Gammaproteobacteria bacterium]
MPISPVVEIVDELRRGRMVIIMDDEDRENEGDVLIAAEHVRAEHINFMARYARGLICLTLTQERCRQLQLPLMVSENGSRMTTNFTVSIEAAEGVTTGISAGDRATTVRAAIRSDAGPRDIVQPGHVFPLMARRGGVLARAGHTEAGIDLPRLAGLSPASVICEILNEDGSMARLPQLEVFANTHGLKIGTIADLIRYRMENESTVQRAAECHISTEFGEFRVVAYHDEIDDTAHLALIRGEIGRDTPTLVRVHVQSSLLDQLTVAHRGLSWTLRAALERVAREGSGVVVVLNQEEPPADLIRQIQHFHRQEQGIELPLRRPHQALRTYGLGSQILSDLGVGKMRVLSNPVKAPGLSGFGLEIVEYISPAGLAEEAAMPPAGSVNLRA